MATSFAIRTGTQSLTAGGQCQTNCPACGKLECLCRPRFFAGQLLTEEDLNRLDHYIVAKNKLHNRYLFGSGTVYGLEVTCHPCKDQVIVHEGYALSPCGNDILVCGDTQVDVCNLIRACRDAGRRQADCNPFGQTASDAGCPELEQDWILSICYDEVASRGITALRSAGGGSCSCGDSSAGGGGGACATAGRQGAKVAYRPTTSRTAAAQCEPTVICEGFHFEVCPAPRATLSDRRQVNRANALAPAGGALGQRFMACYVELVDGLPTPPDGQASNFEWFRWCSELKQAVVDFFSQHGTYDCLLDEKLAKVSVCPDPNQHIGSDEYQKQVKESVGQLTAVAATYLRYCSAILPPGPTPAETDCVPLAVITVRCADCHIIDICNLSARTFAMTFPSLEYWLSPLGLDRLLQPLLNRVCCTPERSVLGGRTVRFDARTAINTQAMVRGAYTKPAPEAFAVALRQASARKGQAVDTQAMFLDALGALDANQQPLLTNEERQFPLQTLLAHDLVLPAFSRLVPPGRGPVVDRGGPVIGGPGPNAAPPAPGPAPAAPAAGPDELAALRQQLDQLRQLVEEQSAQIAELKPGRGGSRKRGNP